MTVSAAVARVREQQPLDRAPVAQEKARAEPLGLRRARRDELERRAPSSPDHPGGSRR